jgi:hypothetical protein
MLGTFVVLATTAGMKQKLKYNISMVLSLHVYTPYQTNQQIYRLQTGDYTKNVTITSWCNQIKAKRAE